MGLPSSEARSILERQFIDVWRKPVHGISVGLMKGNDVFEWNLTIVGPPDTIYEHGVYTAVMKFPANYPNSPPTVTFTSEIWHPNVSLDGKAIVPILINGGWSPGDKVQSLLLAIMSMLESPMTDESPAEIEVALPTKKRKRESSSSAVASNHTACSIEGEHSFTLKSFDKQFKCDGCKLQGFGTRYRCLYCDYELHQECMCPKSTTFHEFFGDLEFRFFDKPQVVHHGRCCDACGKDILGFNYQSVDGKRYLHPCCIKLSKKLRIEDTIFELHKKMSAKCIWCREKKISGGSVSGWGYASRCGDYHFHVHCLMEILHTNASMEDGNNRGLEKIDLQHLGRKSKNKGKGRGRMFSRTVKIFLKTVLSTLLGDPSTLLAGAVVELLFSG